MIRDSLSDRRGRLVVTVMHMVVVGGTSSDSRNKMITCSQEDGM